MSRYRGNSDKCPCCGITYGRFRTGLTYRDVYLFLPWHENPADGIPKRPGTVLGKWHQIKKEWWHHHLDECGKANEHVNETAAAE